MGGVINENKKLKTKNEICEYMKNPNKNSI